MRCLLRSAIHIADLPGSSAVYSEIDSISQSCLRFSLRFFNPAKLVPLVFCTSVSGRFGSHHVCEHNRELCRTDILSFASLPLRCCIMPFLCAMPSSGLVRLCVFVSAVFLAFSAAMVTCSALTVTRPSSRAPTPSAPHAGSSSAGLSRTPETCSPRRSVCVREGGRKREREG